MIVIKHAVSGLSVTITEFLWMFNIICLRSASHLLKIIRLIPIINPIELVPKIEYRHVRIHYSCMIWSSTAFCAWLASISDLHINWNLTRFHGHGLWFDKSISCSLFKVIEYLVIDHTSIRKYILHYSFNRRR